MYQKRFFKDCPGQGPNLGSFVFLFFLSQAVPYTTRLLHPCVSKKVYHIIQENILSLSHTLAARIHPYGA